MWLVTTLYTDGMFMEYGQFKTKKEAVNYLLDLDYVESGRDGRRVRFENFESSSAVAEIIPMDELRIGETT